jgi:hypothetical protein
MFENPAIHVQIKKYSPKFTIHTEAGKAIGFALEQPLHVVAMPCSALRIFCVYFKTA